MVRPLLALTLTCALASPVPAQSILAPLPSFDTLSTAEQAHRAARAAWRRAPDAAQAATPPDAAAHAATPADLAAHAAAPADDAAHAATPADDAAELTQTYAAAAVPEAIMAAVARRAVPGAWAAEREAEPGLRLAGGVGPGAWAAEREAAPGGAGAGGAVPGAWAAEREVAPGEAVVGGAELCSAPELGGGGSVARCDFRVTQGGGPGAARGSGGAGTPRLGGPCPRGPRGAPGVIGLLGVGR